MKWVLDVAIQSAGMQAGGQIEMEAWLSCPGWCRVWSKPEVTRSATTLAQKREPFQIRCLRSCCCLPPPFAHPPFILALHTTLTPHHTSPTQSWLLTKVQRREFIPEGALPALAASLLFWVLSASES